jgi:hypothetical protein
MIRRLAIPPARCVTATSERVSMRAGRIRDFVGRIVESCVRELAHWSACCRRMHYRTWQERTDSRFIFFRPLAGLWFGKLAEMAEAASVLGIHTYFLLTDVPRAEQRVERRLVSLAHMHLLHLGAHMDGDSGLIRPATASDKLVRQGVTLDLSPGNTSRIDRAALNLSRFTATLAQTPEYNSQLIRVKATAGMPEVRSVRDPVPVFWGISTTLINAVTSDHLHNPEMHLYNQPATACDPVRIEVRRQWTDDAIWRRCSKSPTPSTSDSRSSRPSPRRMHQPGRRSPLTSGRLSARPLQVSGFSGRSATTLLLLTHILSVDLAQD